MLILITPKITSSGVSHNFDSMLGLSTSKIIELSLSYGLNLSDSNRIKGPLIGVTTGATGINSITGIKFGKDYGTHGGVKATYIYAGTGYNWINTALNIKGHHGILGVKFNLSYLYLNPSIEFQRNRISPSFSFGLGL